jgi:hypothetical protein
LVPSERQKLLAALTAIENAGAPALRDAAMRARRILERDGQVIHTGREIPAHELVEIYEARFRRQRSRTDAQVSGIEATLQRLASVPAAVVWALLGDDMSAAVVFTCVDPSVVVGVVAWQRVVAGAGRPDLG